MSARRPLHPLSARAANIASGQYMDPSQAGHDDNMSDISGLSSLEDGAEDDFDRLMMQSARDERRLQNALRGNVQPFRKARTHPRVGLTMENLERNAAHEVEETGAVIFRKPSPSNSSGASDPAVRPPVEWGRKARVRKNWLRTITSDTEQELEAQDNTIDRLVEETPRQTGAVAVTADADRPRLSVEDSPLSRKSSVQGTPASSRRPNTNFDPEPDWDFSLDFNEASMIASTPYIPRNMALDDIRQREIDSLKEQAVTTSRLDRIRDASPEATRRPRASSKASEHTTNGTGSTEIVRRKSPILVYKSSQTTVGVVDPGLTANGQTSPKRPTHKREDSQNLLRRLARVSSNTPSPGRGSVSRPQTAPARQQDNHIPETTTETSQPKLKEITNTESIEVQLPQEDPPKPPPERESAPAPVQIAITVTPTQQVETVTVDATPKPQPEAVDVDVTPIPVERSILNAKTPRVTGAWIDTPGPPTARRPREELSQTDSQQTEKASSRKTSSQKGKEPATQEPPKVQAPPEITRPTLPGSALEAIVEEAKTKGTTPRHEDEYGDSTIDSLEEMITSRTRDENREPDEDTLQGLQLPTEPPRNEAERLRQTELAHLHKMNQRLRSARSSVRDASRGMMRVERQVEHIEEAGEATRVDHRECPCVRQSPWGQAWTGFKRLFYHPESSNRRGLTWLSIALLTFLVWFISESLACDRYCHKFYASRMIGYGVDWNAPRYPFVIPTLLYRKLLQPIWSVLSWFWKTPYHFFFDDGVLTETATATMVTMRQFTTKVLQDAQRETFEPDLRIDDDEFI